MEGRDGPSPGGGGGSMQGNLGFHLQQRPIPSVNTGGGLHAPAPLRPTTTAISLASPSSDGAGSPRNLMSMNIGQAGTYSGGVGSPNVARPDPQKRKRGRPRKYPGTDGGGVTLGTSLALTSVTPTKGLTSPSEKRGRGRPPGSGKKQQLAAFAASNGGWLTGTAGSGFIPHVITIAAGEDVANKIFAFCQQGPRAVCVLSANGSISNVTLRHDSSYGGSITYEGRYEILSLSGSFLPTDVNGARSRTGGLSVSLAASDGKVVGGSVSGLLVAATPVQIVVGSFVVSDSGVKNRLPTSPLGAGNGESMVSLMTTSIGLSPPTGTSGVTAASVPPPARPTKTETSGSKSSGQGGTPSHQSVNHQGGNGTPTNAQHSSVGQFGGWQPPQSDSARRSSTDINISLPGG
ncbi:unnamed protein product [Calypogeia fissa]